MRKIHFDGDWTPEEVQQYTNLIKFGAGEGDGAADTIETSVAGGLLSARQKRLLKLFRESVEAGRKACSEGIHCEPQQLSDDLQKSLFGRITHSAEGEIKRDRPSQKWVRDRASSGSYESITGFSFFTENGEFGNGVYLPVAKTVGGGVRIRVHLNLTPSQLISEKRFNDLEDFIVPLDVQLDRENIRAIAQRGNKGVDLLFIRDPNDIEVLGVVEGSGTLPDNINSVAYQLVWLDEGENLTAELEVKSQDITESLQKSLFQESKLNSKSRKAYAPSLSKQSIREAIKRCRKDEIPIDQVKIEVVNEFPDYLPDCLAFCYPSESKIYLVNHDPLEQIHKRQQMLIHQLSSAIEEGVIDPKVAMDAIAQAGKIDENWWLEELIKHYVGICLISKICNPLTTTNFSPLNQYLAFLSGRGLTMRRQNIVRCVGEDYRCAYDPFGLPNLEIPIADLALPEVSAIVRQTLINLL